VSAPIHTGASEAPPSAQVETTGAPAPASAPGPAATTPAGKSYDWERDAKEARSRYDRFVEEVKPVQEVLRAYNLDPKQAANALVQFDAVLKDPTLGPLARERIMTGKTPPVATSQPAAPTDEYVDPDVKALRDELAEVKNQLANVSRNAHTTASTQVSGLINQHESEFLGGYNLTVEEKQKFAESFSHQFDWMVKNHPEQLMNMKRETYRRVALPVLDEILQEGGGILGLAQRGLAQRQQGLAARATDAPLRAQTTGTEPAAPAQFSAAPRESDLKRVAREAAAEYRRSRGLAQ
jgi:hypothetical protein